LFRKGRGFLLFGNQIRIPPGLNVGFVAGKRLSGRFRHDESNTALFPHIHSDISIKQKGNIEQPYYSWSFNITSSFSLIFYQITSKRSETGSIFDLVKPSPYLTPILWPISWERDSIKPRKSGVVR